jgi:hypothetical protein
VAQKGMAPKINKSQYQDQGSGWVVRVPVFRPSLIRAFAKWNKLWLRHSFSGMTTVHRAFSRRPVLRAFDSHWRLQPNSRSGTRIRPENTPAARKLTFSDPEKIRELATLDEARGDS